MSLTDILDRYPDQQFLKADGFDDAIIGVCTNTLNLVYSRSKAIDILIKEGLSRSDANEHFDFNVSGSYVGDKTPVWVEDEL